ncbi:MAG: DUF2094 domain-containing protein [Planctomycetes bacterium]|nr:DUF2094 domain-containing protein [Planctomycetota bacterium]
MSRVGNFFGKLFSGAPSDDGKELALRAYGKLPMYAEYRRLQVAPGAATVYSQWMDAGRLAWVQAAAQRGEKGSMVSSRLLGQLPGQKGLVVASMWDSRDNVGRIFPFSFFITCTPEALGGDAFQRWASAVSVYEQFDRAYAELSVLRSGGDFYRLFRGRNIQVKPDDVVERQRGLIEKASKIDAQEWYDALGLSASTPADWFSSLVRRSARWKRQPDDIAQLAVGCPLAEGIAFDVQAMLWLRWIEPFAQRARKTPWMVSPGNSGGSGRSTYLILRDLMPDDFQLLTSQAGDYGFVEHLATTPNAAPAGSASVVPPQGSLLSWLSSLSPVKA